MKKSTLNKIAKVKSRIEDLAELLEELHSSEQEVFENRSERYRESDKGQRDESDLYYLEEAFERLHEAYSSLGNLELED